MPSLEIRQGSDWRRTLTRYDANGIAVDPTGAYARAICMANQCDELKLLFDIDTAELGGIEIDETNKRLVLELDSLQTADMEPARDARMNVWIAYQNGEEWASPMLRVVVLRSYAKAEASQQ